MIDLVDSISYSTMSASLHQPPGQGRGIFTLFLYSDRPFPHTFNSLGSIKIGVAYFALAASVRKPITFFHIQVSVEPGQ